MVSQYLENKPLSKFFEMKTLCDLAHIWWNITFIISKAHIAICWLF